MTVSDQRSVITNGLRELPDRHGSRGEQRSKPLGQVHGPMPQKERVADAVEKDENHRTGDLMRACHGEAGAPPCIQWTHTSPARENRPPDEDQWHPAIFGGERRKATVNPPVSRRNWGINAEGRCAGSFGPCCGAAQQVEADPQCGQLRTFCERFDGATFAP
jgi:hypothetical protein